ncbi:hypothetical protein D3C87_1700340 [compost metagenome]
MRNDFLAKKVAPFKYPPVTFSKILLKPAKNLASHPFCSLTGFVGCNSMAQRAGLSERALNAEKATETAIVMANC